VNTAVEITGIIALCALVLTAIAVTAAANEWLGFSCSLSLRFMPRSKRQPRTAVEVRHVIPDATAPAAPVESITSARRPA
jgi:hypothetical protein